MSNDDFIIKHKNENQHVESWVVHSGCSCFTYLNQGNNDNSNNSYECMISPNSGKKDIPLTQDIYDMTKKNLQNDFDKVKNIEHNDNSNEQFNKDTKVLRSKKRRKIDDDEDNQINEMQPEKLNNMNTIQPMELKSDISQNKEDNKTLVENQSKNKKKLRSIKNKKDEEKEKNPENESTNVLSTILSEELLFFIHLSDLFKNEKNN